MSKSEPSRRERILDAAERTFAEAGFQGASLRDIVREAKVNLATVYYYFGSKHGLIDAVLQRRFHPLRAQQLAMLRQFEADAKGKPLPVQKVLAALLQPPLQLALTAPAKRQAVARLIGRIVTEPDPELQDFLRSQHAEVRAAFLQSLHRSLPAATETDLRWRMEFVLGALAFVLCNPRKIERETRGACNPVDTERVLAEMIEFFAPGFRAANGQPGPKSGAKDRGQVGAKEIDRSEEARAEGRVGRRAVAALRLGWLTVLALPLAACSPSKPPPPKVKVTVSQPQTATVTNWDEYPGHLEAVEMVELRPRVPGYLESVHFEDGAEVKQGDLLFVIDPKPFQAELDRSQAVRQQAETRLELARGDLGRAEGLHGTKAISDEEYDTRLKAVREAEGAVAATRAAEASARLNLDYTRITAPISGKIGRRLVTAGNLVQLQGSGGATVLGTIVSLDPIYCYFDVEEGAGLIYRSSAKAATANERTGAGVPCQLALVNETGFTHQGHIDFFDNQVNSQTGTIRLRGLFRNADRVLVPGMFANLRVLAGPPGPALLVPDVAVGSDQGYKFVYIVNSENKVETRSIQTGRAYGAQRSVLKGLKAEDRVIVNGLMMLRPGMPVEAQSAEPKSDTAGSRLESESQASGNSAKRP